MTNQLLRSPLKSLPYSRWRQFQRSLMLGAVVAGALLVLWLGNFFTHLRLRLDDIYFVPTATSGNVVIVAIDDASLAAYGRTPAEWSRTVYADLVTQLKSARVVAFDVLFAEPTEDDSVLVTAIQDARMGDARTRFIMPEVGIERRPVDTDVQAIAYQSSLQPLSSLLDVVDNVGYVNIFADADDTIRRQFSRVEVDSNTQLSFGLAVYMAYLRIPRAAIEQVVQSSPGLLNVTPERSIPVDSDGIWRPNFFGPPSTNESGTFEVFSAQDVIAGRVDAAQFADKIVLIGVQGATGLTDLYSVPSSNSSRMSGVEIHANAIETLIQNAPIVDHSRLNQGVLIVLFALGTSVLYGQLRWYWMLLAAFILTSAWVLYAFLNFSARREVIDLFYPTLALLTPVVMHWALDTVTEINRRRRSEFLLQSLVTVSTQRLDLDKIARSIAEDVQGFIPASGGEIWLQSSQGDKLRVFHRWVTVEPGNFETVVQQASKTLKMAQQANQIAVPMVWQGETGGVIALQTAKNTHAPDKAVKLLHALAQQMAPSLENAHLLAETGRQKSLLEAIFAASPAGILILDGDLRVVRSNFAVDKALVVPGASFIGRPLTHMLTDAGVVESTQERLSESFKKHQAFRDEIKHHDKTLVVESAPLRHAQEWVVVLSDVSPLAELSDLKTRMIRMASHDLKNPLTGILGFGELLLNPDSPNPLPAGNRQYVEYMVRAGNDMLNIITDILNLEQMRSGGMEQQPVALAPLIDEVVEQHLPEIQAKAQIYVREIDADLPKIMGDQRTLAQAFTNLVGNAVKYTPDGGRITVRLHKQATVILFEVQDTGYGIPEDGQAKLFQEFYRVKTKATSGISGTGLGLSLVKSTVEAHGGRIWVQSQEGVGSTFSVELPFIHESTI